MEKPKPAKTREDGSKRSTSSSSSEKNEESPRPIRSTINMTGPEKVISSQESDKPPREVTLFDIQSSQCRVKKTFRIFTHLVYCWGDFLDVNGVMEVLQPGQCLVVEGKPRIMLLGLDMPRFYLNYKTMNNMIITKELKFCANEILLVQGSIKLHHFLKMEKLKIVTKKKFFEQKDIELPSTPFNDMSLKNLFEMGDVSRGRLQVTNDKKHTVLCISGRDLTPDEIGVVLKDIKKMLDFGNMNILRLWGVSVQDKRIILICEDIPIGPLADEIRKNRDDRSNLMDYTQQICSALHYCELNDFVHKKLSMDVCQLTSKNQVKVVIFGLSTGVFPKRIYPKEVDRSRWLPWNCLTACTDPVYDQIDMVWTFGAIVWSIFHECVLPYENETSETIRNPEWRKTAALPRMLSILPRNVDECLDKCFLERNERPKMCQIQIVLNHTC